jgi:FtsH-binding integral membrane protein
MPHNVLLSKKRAIISCIFEKKVIFRNIAISSVYSAFSLYVYIFRERRMPKSKSKVVLIGLIITTIMTAFIVQSILIR